MNREVTFQLVCTTAVQRETAAREDFKTQGKKAAAATSKPWIRDLTFLSSVFLVQAAFLMTREVSAIPVKGSACSSHLQLVARIIESPNGVADSQHLRIFKRPFHRTKVNTRNTAGFSMLSEKKYHTFDLLRVLKSCIISKIKPWEPFKKP